MSNKSHLSSKKNMDFELNKRCECAMYVNILWHKIWVMKSRESATKNSYWQGRNGASASPRRPFGDSGGPAPGRRRCCPASGGGGQLWRPTRPHRSSSFPLLPPFPLPSLCPPVTLTADGELDGRRRAEPVSSALDPASSAPDLALPGLADGVSPLPLLHY